MFSYRALFRQAWEISWRHKYLWFFGLFASLAAGSGSWEYQIMTQNMNQGLIDGAYVHLSKILTLGVVVKNFFLGLTGLFSYDIWTICSVFAVLIVSGVIFAFFVWLAVASQAALIGDTKKLLEDRKKEPALSIRSGLTDGNRHFWRVLGLDFLIRVAVGGVLFLGSLPLLFLAMKDSSVLAVIFSVLFVIFIPVALSLSLLVKYAIAYAVLEGKSVASSLEHGSRLFAKNWLISVEAAIILFLINFLASGVLVIAFSLFLLPLVILGLILQIAWIMWLMVIIGIVIIVFFGALMTAFQTAAWTNLFLRLKREGGLAKLERLFRR